MIKNRVKDDEVSFDVHISSKHNFFSLDLREIFIYRDLLILMIYRDFKASYKQTVLGPFWFFAQPIINSVVYLFVFGQVLKVDFDGYNPILFYLSGVTFWNLFSSTLTISSNVFISNSGLFSKIYFPRILVPISVLVSALFRFIIQFLFIVLLIIFIDDININFSFFSLINLISSVFLIGILGISIGLFIANYTRKYRDLIFLISFGLQLLMYISPILYPIQLLKQNNLDILMFNPILLLIQLYRTFFFDVEFIGVNSLVALTFFIGCVFFFSILMFNRVSKNFVDTI